MAYFPNATASAAYEARWCSRCVHRIQSDGEICAVLEVHRRYADNPTGEAEDILDILIPSDANAQALECSMFLDNGDGERGVTEMCDKPKPNAVALLPCPFCGREAYLGESNGEPPYWVSCNAGACEALGPTRNEPEEAIEAWNTRVPCIEKEQN